MSMFLPGPLGTSVLFVMMSVTKCIPVPVLLMQTEAWETHLTEETALELNGCPHCLQGACVLEHFEGKEQE